MFVTDEMQSDSDLPMAFVFSTSKMLIKEISKFFP